jgi:hypothetical protein
MDGNISPWRPVRLSELSVLSVPLREGTRQTAKFHLSVWTKMPDNGQTDKGARVGRVGHLNSCSLASASIDKYFRLSLHRSCTEGPRWSRTRNGA